MKTISIVYCGGCNEAYGRVDMVKEIISRLSGLPGGPLVQVAAGEPCDMALIVCGCMAVCTGYRKAESKGRVTHVLGPNYLDAAEMPQEEIIERIVCEFTGL